MTCRKESEEVEEALSWVEGGLLPMNSVWTLW